MKRSSLLLMAILMSVYSFSQDAVLISENSSYSTINIRANTTSVPVIKFTRYPGMYNHQHNAFVGQFHNTTLNEYSFGIGTGLSTNQDTDFANNVFTATLTGLIGIGTIAPSHKLEVADIYGIPSLGIKGSLDAKIVFEPSDGSDRFTIWSDMDPNTYNDLLRFGATNSPDILNLKGNGNVGIGTTNPTQKLTVNGTVYSTEVKVDVNAGTGPDYVFEPTYQLPSLSEIETYIKANKHLPEVPSAKEMETDGINLSEMNMLLLKKVEELTLHLIEQNRIIAAQNNRIITLEEKIK